MKKLENIDKMIGRKLKSGVFYFSLLLGWEVVCRVFELPHYLLPSPTMIAIELVNTFPLLMSHAQVTMTQVMIGFLLAIGLGFILSMVMDRYQGLKNLIYPMLVVSQTIPIMAIAPLLMIWFGFGILPKVIVVVLVCFFPVTVSLTEGLSSTDHELIDLMKTMHATERQIFFKCKLPAALPSFFAGLRIAATYSVMGAVVAEWVGAQKGLGIYMTRVMKSYRTPALFANIVVIVVITLLFVLMIDMISKKCMPWKNNQRRIEERG